LTAGIYREKKAKGVPSSEDEDIETAPEKKLRLAREYLSQLEKEGTQKIHLVTVSKIPSRES